MPSYSKVKNWISALSFKPKEGETDIWFKEYPEHKYRIEIELKKGDQAKSIINWGNKIDVERKTTSNFKDDETLVVLECVNRLLKKGYKPESILLEKKWPLGHREKGHLDIMIMNEQTSSPFMMIECKVWGSKHEAEKRKMLNNGGQLFSYYAQDPATKYLCLYSSKLDEDNFQYENDIILVPEEFSGKNTNEMYDVWDKTFANNGIFEQNAVPYNIKFQRITYGALKDLTAEDSGKIFNEFEEILRRHVVSDKPNAFNKIFNLFLCKVVDEDNVVDENEEMDFQWQPGDDTVDVMNKLNDLYKQGMERYLNLEIADFSEGDIDLKLQTLATLDAANYNEIKNIFDTLRLYKNSDFTFKDVFDEKTFRENSTIVKEVVQLLQNIRIKYSSKHQFLGDFFERLLTTSIKQESGQYFTPIPIARFICKSIPFSNVVQKKVAQKDSKFLPYIIDYASGSGHFLTESMDVVQNIIEQYDGKGFTKLMKDNLNIYNVSYSWASEFVYGIEKDYRLAKTTKVSCFLNGDGEANIIRGDGLDNFYTSTEFEKKLKTDSLVLDNQQFDILVANPPYSVPGFKNTIQGSSESFELFDFIGEKSQEIECLFIERAKHLIKEDGYVGIILPSSILSNKKKIYEGAREIILKYFNIKGIVELGTSTFMATPIKTVILFLKRKSNNQWLKVNQHIEKFFKEYKDVAVNGIEFAFSVYVENVWKDISITDYIEMLHSLENENVQKSEMYKTYVSTFNNLTEIKNLKNRKAFFSLSEEEKNELITDKFVDYLISKEKEKILYFLLTYNQRVVLAKSGDKKPIERSFLGYEFNNSRGDEGIKIKHDKDGNIISKLYSETDIFDEEKVNSYILNNFLDNDIEQISESLKNHVQIRNVHELIVFNTTNFIKHIGTSFIKPEEYDIKTKWPKSTLEEEGFNFISGIVYDKEDESYDATNNKLLTASHIDLATGKLTPNDPTYIKNDVSLNNAKQLKKGDVFVCVRSGSMSHLGKNTFIEEDTSYYFGAFCAVLRNKSHHKSKLISEILKFPEFSKYVQLHKKQNINMLAKEHLLNFKVPVLPDNKIEEVIDSIKQLDHQNDVYQKQLFEVDQYYETIISNWKSRDSLRSICDVVSEQIDPQEHKYTRFNYIGLENIQSNTGERISFESVLGQEILSTKNIFKENDVLYGRLRPYLNKVYLSELDGICSTDILVLRSNGVLDKKILKRILLSKYVVDVTTEESKGMRQPRIATEKLMSIQVPIPEDKEKALNEFEDLDNEKERLHNLIKAIEKKKEMVIRQYLK